MTLSRPAWIGLAIIVGANVIGFGGVAYNRAGEPDAVLRLSERELRVPYSDLHDENSGMTVEVVWCVDRPSISRREFAYLQSDCYGREPEWLDSARVASLGFNVDVDPRVAKASEYYNRQLPKKAFVVLELGGAAYDSSIAALHDYVASQDSLLARHPDSTALQRQVQNTDERAKTIERESSRLFAVDVGRSIDVLRARYPDRSKFAIMRASVRPRIVDYRKPRVGGVITDIAPVQLNVPHDLQAAFASVRMQPGPRVAGTASTSTPSLNVDVAFGKRLEPWILAAKR
jgi:uncharacterized protein DUF4824